MDALSLPGVQTRCGVRYRKRYFLIIGHVHAKYCSIVEFAQNRNNWQILLFHTDRQQGTHFEAGKINDTN